MKNPDIVSDNLQTISKEDLLNKRICDLTLSLETPFLTTGINKLYSELESKGISFRPEFYLTDEWGCPNEKPIVGIPFYLAHPKLIELEKEIMLEAEGSAEEEYMKILRHETGHALNYAYKLYNQPQWHSLFGLFTKQYTETYKPRQYSKSYVRHLGNWYAQSHPDEDFAETFAVWLTPNIDWRKIYKGWPVIKKLEYVENIMKGISQKPLLVKPPRQKERPVSKITSILKNLYIKKRKKYAHEYPDFFDSDLRDIFFNEKDIKDLIKASAFLKKHKEMLIDTIYFWTTENKYTINQLLKNMIVRCSQLGLTADNKKTIHIIMDLSSYLTTLIMNYYYKGTFIGE